MYGTYLRRELLSRKRQTIIVAAGLAIAIALVVIVSALSSGVRNAQTEALQSVYGVGTDLTVTGAPAEPGEGGFGGPRFEFGAEDGTTGDDGSTSLSQSQLRTDFRRGTLEADQIEAIANIDGVAAVTGALSLTNSTFSGEIPDFSQMQQPGSGEGGMPGGGGGAPGAGGSAFGIDSFTVLGVDPGQSEAGPLSAVTVSDGRAFTAADAGADVALVDAAYAESNGISAGDSIEVGGATMTVVGLLASASDEADTASDVYLPLDTAQQLSGAGEVVSTVYVQAASASDIEAVQEEIQAALPDATVSSQSELAATVSGSLSSAASLIQNLGIWLSAIALLVALALAALFTVSGVSRRTREFGTLKALGWSNSRVVRQVAGESLVQGLVGGALGLVIALAAILGINLAAPVISAGSTGPDAAGAMGAGGMGAGGMGGPPGAGAGGPGDMMGAAMTQGGADVVLQAPLSPGLIGIALAIAIGGGLIAGVLGGWRASRLSPAAALRTVN